MEKTLKTAHPESGNFRLIGPLLLLVLLFTAGTVQAGDFLKQSAFKTSHPTACALLDITRSGKRLVAVGERGLIIFSDDSGNSWTQAQVPVRTTLTGICFSDPENGWAIGHETVLLHSRDGGSSWQKTLDGTTINQMMVKAMQAIVDDLHKQAQNATEAESARLKNVIEDAEVNLRGFKETAAEGPIQPLLDIDFINPQEGIIVGAFGIILRTADGGRNWTPLLDRISNPMGYHFYGLARTRDQVFIFGEAGGMYRSHDAGRHWEPLESPYQGSFFNALGDPRGGLVAGFGLRGNLVISRDDGNTWQHLQLGQGAALTGGCRLSERRFILVGMAGVIYLGQSSQAELKTVKTGFPACMAAAEAPDGNLVLVGLRGIKKITLNPDTHDKEVTR